MLQIFVLVPGALSLLGASLRLPGDNGKMCCRMQIRYRLQVQLHLRFCVWSVWSLKKSAVFINEYDKSIASLWTRNSTAFQLH